MHLKQSFKSMAPFLHRLLYITEGYVCDVWAMHLKQSFKSIAPFLHRRGYITEGYVCDVWAMHQS